RRHARGSLPRRIDQARAERPIESAMRGHEDRVISLSFSPSIGNAMHPNVSACADRRRNATYPSRACLLPLRAPNVLAVCSKAGVLVCLFAMGSFAMTVKLRVFSFTLLLAASSFATTFVVPDDAELIAKSRAIVVGTIELAEAQRTADGVETSYSLRLERVLKGNLATARPLLIVSPGGEARAPARPLWIVSPGGKAGGLAQAVDGAAHFTVGDRALLFLVFEGGRWQVT